MDERTRTSFAADLIRWQKRCGRHDLPWQQQRDPYRLWLAEVMLQQTQVATVIPYYLRFIERLPDITRLAAATPDTVLGLWSGLGYYARARNLQRAAQYIVIHHGGRFPHRIADIEKLPGIGRSSAASIAVFAFGKRAAILDGNVRRVLARVFAIVGPTHERPVEKRLWQIAGELLPHRDLRTYTQGLMDLGALVCTRAKPRCGECPLARHCLALRDNRVAELPTPRQRPAQPQRSTHLLVLLHDDRVLLQPRPAHGLWGGLLSLPECPPENARAQAAALPVVRHAFTHFRLDIHPWLQKVSAGDTAPAGIWLALDALDGAPLPAPIRRILESLPDRI